MRIYALKMKSIWNNHSFIKIWQIGNFFKNTIGEKDDQYYVRKSLQSTNFIETISIIRCKIHDGKMRLDLFISPNTHNTTLGYQYSKLYILIYKFCIIKHILNVDLKKILKMNIICLMLKSCFTVVRYDVCGGSALPDLFL